MTGTWYEKTSSSGEYRGSVFHGAVQFILNTELGTAEGKWIGFNNTRSKVNVGDWSLTKK